MMEMVSEQERALADAGKTWLLGLALAGGGVLLLFMLAAYDNAIAMVVASAIAAVVASVRRGNPRAGALTGVVGMVAAFAILMTIW